MISWWESLTTFQHFLGLLGIAATFILIVQLILSLFGLFGSSDIGDSGSSSLEDLDGDGFPDIDLDGDGIPDLDLNGDGIPDIDLDGDGFPDLDLNNDGFPDSAFDAHIASDSMHGALHHTDKDSLHSLDISNMAFGFSDILNFRGIVSFCAIFSWLSLALIENNINTILSLIISFIVGFIVMVLLGYLFFRIKHTSYSGTLDNRNALGLSGRVYLRIPPNETGTGKIQLTVQSRYAELEAVTRWSQEIPTGEIARVVSVRKDDVLVVEPVTISKDIELKL